MLACKTSRSELAKLKDLDSLLKCGICYEYFKIALITPCSHNYCSLCIRQSLMYRKQCPSCFEDVHESELRNNRIVDELITVYNCVKDKLSDFLSNIPLPKTNVENSESNQSTQRKNCQALIGERVADAFTSKSCGNGSAHLKSTPTKNEAGTSKKEILIPSMFSPKKPKASNINIVKVSCPVCNVEIPEKNINIHLDACIRGSPEKRDPPSEKRKLLPKLVYHLLPEKELRKKLNELGLSSVGDRTTLINRHKRYTLLYNSECDSLKPRPVSEIIKQLKKEEEEEKKLPPVVKKLNVDRKADLQTNEEAKRQYLQENKSSFQKLIEEARKSKEVNRNINVVNVMPEVFTVDENSDSENELKIKQPAHKRHIITSDSDHEEETEDTPILKTQADVYNSNIPSSNKHSLENTFNNRNEQIVKQEINDGDQHKEDKFYNESDVSTDDNLEENISQAVTTRRRKIKKLSNDQRHLQHQANSDVLASVTSPVLGNKCRSDSTPKSACGQMNSVKRNLTPDLKLQRDHPPALEIAGHVQEERIDSDSSSNHSTSLMVYTGPDCDDSFDHSSPVKTPVKNCPKDSTTTSSKSNFDIGIESILQNSEDFMLVPFRRQSSRIKESKQTTPNTESRSRRARKRIRIDDL